MWITLAVIWYWQARARSARSSSDLGSEVAAQTGDEAAVAQAVEAFRKAMLAKGSRAIRGVFARISSAYGHSAGRDRNKEPVHRRRRERTTSVWKFITLSDQTAQIVGNNAIAPVIS